MYTYTPKVHLKWKVHSNIKILCQVQYVRV